MPTPVVEFVALSQNSPSIDAASLSQEASCIAAGPQEFSDVVSQLSDVDFAGWENSEIRTVVVPVGDFGSLLWESLPWSVARVVAGVRPEAIVLLHRDSLPNVSQTIAFADLLPSDPKQVTIAKPIPASQLAGKLPSLAAGYGVPLQGAEPSSEEFGSGIAGTALRAGLVHILGDLDRCHRLAQSIEGQGNPPNGDYWHAIVHRREPDYGNSKYWFRHVGQHPVYPELSQFTAQLARRQQDRSVISILESLARDSWNSSRVVDLCREVEGDEDSPLGVALQQIQWAEMLLLLKHSAAHLK